VNKSSPAFFEFQASIKINNLHGINVEVSDDSRRLHHRCKLLIL